MEEVVPLKSAVLHAAAPAPRAAEAQHRRSQFRFQQRTGKLDLRKIGAVDVDAVIREVDVEALQELLENITFANISEDEIRCMADPVLAKMFKITQLIVEYLLHVQHTLGAGLTELVAKYQQKKKLVAEKQAVVDELQRCQRELQDEVRRQRQTISTLEHMLRVAARKRAQLVAARERQQQQEQPQQSTTAAQPQAQPTSASSTSSPNSAATPPSTLRVSVAMPDGTVLAIPVSATQTVQELLYITAAQLQLDSVQQLRLMFRGAQLPSHLRLTDCGISDGDQLTAMIAIPVPHVPAPAPRTDDKGTQEVVAVMQQTLEQNKAMMESAVRLIARLYEQKQAAEHESSNTALLHDEIRLLKNQLELRTNMMDERVQSLSEALVSQAAATPRVVTAASRAGDLEDDIDVSTPRSRPVPDPTVLQQFPTRRKPLLRRAKPAAARAQIDDEPTTPRQDRAPRRNASNNSSAAWKPHGELVEQPETLDSPMPHLRQSAENMAQSALSNTNTSDVPSAPPPEEVSNSAFEPPLQPPPAELNGDPSRIDNGDGDHDDDDDSKLEEKSDSPVLVPEEAAEDPTEEPTDRPDGSPSSNRSTELRPDVTTDSFCPPPSLQHTFDKTMSSVGNATTSIVLDATANTDISVPDETEVAKRADEYERSAAAATAALATTTHSADEEGQGGEESELLPEADTKPETLEPIEDTSLVFSESSSTVALLNESFVSASEDKR